MDFGQGKKIPGSGKAFPATLPLTLFVITFIKKLPGAGKEFLNRERVICGGRSEGNKKHESMSQCWPGDACQTLVGTFPTPDQHRNIDCGGAAGAAEIGPNGPVATVLPTGRRLASPRTTQADRPGMPSENNRFIKKS
jgi:hypothetical protein